MDAFQPSSQGCNYNKLYSFNVKTLDDEENAAIQPRVNICLPSKKRLRHAAEKRSKIKGHVA